MTDDPQHPDLPPEAEPEHDASGAPPVPAGGRDPEGRAGRGRRGVVGGFLAVLAVVIVSLNLRPGATSLGPLMADVVTSYGQGGTASGFLTALPCLAFGVLGAVAVPVSRRIGLTGTVVASFVLVTLGLLLRPTADTFLAFTLLSVLALVGPALGNVVVPAWIKRHGGRRSVLLVTTYTTVLAVGGAAGSMLAVPLAPGGGEGWRDSLQFWGLISVGVVAVWAIVLTRTGHDFPPEGPQGTLRTSLLRSPTAIALTVMFALQSTNAYTQFGLLPQILTDSGVTPARAGLIVGSISGWGIVGGLLMPTIIDRSRRLPWIVGGLGLLTASGYAGLLLAPGLSPLLWTSVLGIGGVAFPSVLALIPARSRDPLITARLSGMVQPVGYLLAALGPISAGAVLEARGTSAMLILMGSSGLLLAVAGYRAARPRMVDDELSA